MEIPLPQSTTDIYSFGFGKNLYKPFADFASLVDQQGFINADSIATTTLSNITSDLGTVTQGILGFGSDIFGQKGIQLDYNNGVPREYIGNGLDQFFKFDGEYISWKGLNAELTPGGLLSVTNIYAIAGNIGGLYLSSASLYNNILGDDSSTFLIDSTNGLLRLGVSTSYLLLDGANLVFQSSNYVSGPTGSGFSVSPTLSEFGDLRARGKFTSSVFETESISAIGGNVLATKGADVLDADMTALDNSTLIQTESSLGIGDILHIKDAVNDEWLEVTDINSAPTYTVTRDKYSQYGADANPVWKKGQSVVNYGLSGAGGILLSATTTPHFDVFSHSGSPWTDAVTHLRIGNLNGFLGYNEDLFGAALGTASSYLKYDPTNGLRLKSTNSQIDVGSLGYVLGGQTAYETGTGFYLGYSGGLYKFSIGSTAEYMKWSGTGLEIKGAITASYPINLATYATADLPEPAGDTGFNAFTSTA